MTTLDHLAQPAPPWVGLIVLLRGQTPDDLGAGLPGFAVRRIDGRRCGTKTALLKEFARALDFPAHFGQNWDALEDCLTDLEWLPAAGYLLVVTDADRVMPGHEDDYGTLVAILETAGAEWATARSGVAARPPRPFHALLTVAAARVGRRRDWRVPVLHGSSSLDKRDAMLDAGTGTGADAETLPRPDATLGKGASDDRA